MTFTEFRLAARRSFLQPLWLQRLCSDFATSLRITLFLCDIFIFSLVFTVYTRLCCVTCNLGIQPCAPAPFSSAGRGLQRAQYSFFYEPCARSFQWLSAEVFKNKNTATYEKVPQRFPKLVCCAHRNILRMAATPRSCSIPRSMLFLLIRNKQKQHGQNTPATAETKHNRTHCTSYAVFPPEEYVPNTFDALMTIQSQPGNFPG